LHRPVLEGKFTPGFPSSVPPKAAFSLRPLAGVLAPLVFLLVLPGSTRSDPLPEHAREVVDYRIEVRLDPKAKQLQGQERLTWRNPSTEPVAELWFHLYLNAFKNSESTFYRESSGRLRGDRAREGGWGWIDVTSMRLEDGTDLLPHRTFEHPDDDNTRDETVMRVSLPRPVPPAGSVSLDITFAAQLPKVYARTGYVRDYYLVGQWFPKLGVYEPAGVRGRSKGGWNCHQFHAHTEFYADYGRYRVEITVPRPFVVGATGRRVARRDNPDQTSTYTYEEADIHDFAWTADPGFVEVKRTFSATEDVTPAEYSETAQRLDRTADEVRLSDVEITFLMQPQHLPQLERLVAAARLSLKHFGLAYGRYPYPSLTVVDPAKGGMGSAGMEYPAFVTGGTSFLFNRWPLDRVHLVEDVIVHEIGHQFWYGLVGSNEFEEAWLDEGLTSYSTSQVMDLGYGKDASVGELLGLRAGTLEAARLTNGPQRLFDAIRRPAWKYSSFGSYAFNSYARPQLVLRTLESRLGPRTMARVMRTYSERWRFRHPGSDDFYAVAQEVSGEDLRSFFASLVEQPGLVDYEVSSVESEKASEPRGVFDRKGKRETVLDDDAEKGEEEADEKKTRPYESTVMVRRRGEVVLPVDVELVFEGVPPERRAWDGRDRWIRYEVTRPERLLSARVDPDGKLPLDVSGLNNSRRVEGDSRAAVHWGVRWMFWIQHWLALLGM
jgi:Peptidase family M1 domain